MTGAEKASQAGADPIVAVAMGVITATFGGIIRDLLGGESPIILSREIYASAALAGALIFVFLMAIGASRESAVAVGFALGLLIRGAALRYGWSLPRHRQRPDSPSDSNIVRAGGGVWWLAIPVAEGFGEHAIALHQRANTFRLSDASQGRYTGEAGMVDTWYRSCATLGGMCPPRTGYFDDVPTCSYRDGRHLIGYSMIGLKAALRYPKL